METQRVGVLVDAYESCPGEYALNPSLQADLVTVMFPRDEPAFDHSSFEASATPIPRGVFHVKVLNRPIRFDLTLTILNNRLSPIQDLRNALLGSFQRRGILGHESGKNGLNVWHW